jgi:hypothetical protein
MTRGGELTNRERSGPRGAVTSEANEVSPIPRMLYVGMKTDHVPSSLARILQTRSFPAFIWAVDVWQ